MESGTRRGCSALLHLQIQRAHDLAPAVHLGFDEASELFRRGELDIDAETRHRRYGGGRTAIRQRAALEALEMLLELALEYRR